MREIQRQRRREHARGGQRVGEPADDRGGHARQRGNLGHLGARPDHRDDLHNRGGLRRQVAQPHLDTRGDRAGTVVLDGTGVVRCHGAVRELIEQRKRQERVTARAAMAGRTERRRRVRNRSRGEIGDGDLAERREPKVGASLRGELVIECAPGGNEQNRQVVKPAREVPEPAHRGIVAPLRIVDEQRERGPGGEIRTQPEQRVERPEQRRGRLALRLGQPKAPRGGRGRAGEQRSVGAPLEELARDSERQAALELTAARTMDGEPGIGRDRAERVQQRGLADARRPLHDRRHSPAAARSFGERPQLPELALALEQSGSAAHRRQTLPPGTAKDCTRTRAAAGPVDLVSGP